MLLKEKKQKKALLLNSKNLKNIHNDYYAKTEYTNIEYNNTIVRVKYNYYARDILIKYHLGSFQEMFFLLHYYAGEVLYACEFCGQNITRIIKRDNTYNYNDCKHTGTCIMCKKPYQDANHDLVCYVCKPHKFYDRTILDTPDKIRYFYLRVTANEEFMSEIDNVDTAQKMMDMASFYYSWFKDIKDNLTKRISIKNKID